MIPLTSILSHKGRGSKVGQWLEMPNSKEHPVNSCYLLLRNLQALKAKCSWGRSPIRSLQKLNLLFDTWLFLLTYLAKSLIFYPNLFQTQTTGLFCANERQSYAERQVQFKKFLEKTRKAQIGIHDSPVHCAKIKSWRASIALPFLRTFGLESFLSLAFYLPCRWNS